jgi:hypothetical protein
MLNALNNIAVKDLLNCVTKYLHLFNLNRKICFIGNVVFFCTTDKNIHFPKMDLLEKFNL